MTGKKMIAVLFLAAILLVPTLMFLNGGLQGLPAVTLSAVSSGDYGTMLDESFRDRFSHGSNLSGLAWNARYRTGAKEIDGYFITDKSIIKNIGAPDATLVSASGDSIRAFARRMDIPTYFMLIPTACAVKQQELPSFAASIIHNQKSFIQSVYQSFGGELYTADVYSILVQNQNKYLYYNTEDRLTPQGGYYIYSVVADKLDASVRTLDNYTIEYVRDRYYGSLQTKFPYARIQPDLLSLYHFRSGNGNFSRAYTVQYTNNGLSDTQNDIYDRSQLDGNQPLNVYLGGIPQSVNLAIRKSDNKPTPNQTKLLIIGDETAAAYVPFLTPHYSEIQIINAATATEEQLSELDILYYSQVLFAFSTDTYMHEKNLQVLSVL